MAEALLKSEERFAFRRRSGRRLCCSFCCWAWGADALVGKFVSAVSVATVRGTENLLTCKSVLPHPAPKGAERLDEVQSCVLVGLSAHRRLCE